VDEDNNENRVDSTLVQKDYIMRIRVGCRDPDPRFADFADIILDEANNVNLKICPFCNIDFPSNSGKSLNLTKKESYIYCGLCNHKITIRSKEERELCTSMLCFDNISNDPAYKY
jgi:hypothetical protein